MSNLLKEWTGKLHGREYGQELLESEGVQREIYMEFF